MPCVYARVMFAVFPLFIFWFMYEVLKIPCMNRAFHTVKRWMGIKEKIEDEDEDYLLEVPSTEAASD